MSLDDKTELEARRKGYVQDGVYVKVNIDARVINKETIKTWAVEDLVNIRDTITERIVEYLGFPSGAELITKETLDKIEELRKIPWVEDRVKTTTPEKSSGERDSGQGMGDGMKLRSVVSDRMPSEPGIGSEPGQDGYSSSPASKSPGGLPICLDACEHCDDRTADDKCKCPRRDTSDGCKYYNKSPAAATGSRGKMVENSSKSPFPPIATSEYLTPAETAGDINKDIDGHCICLRCDVYEMCGHSPCGPGPNGVKPSPKPESPGDTSTEWYTCSNECNKIPCDPICRKLRIEAVKRIKEAIG
jgi:hypothetical protein